MSGGASGRYKGGVVMESIYMERQSPVDAWTNARVGWGVQLGTRAHLEVSTEDRMYDPELLWQEDVCEQ